MVYLSSFFAHQNTAQAIQVAQEALAEIPVTDLKLRSSLFSTLYRAYGMEGDIEKSAPAYRECLRLALAAGEYGMVADTTMVRAFDLCQYGRFDEAAAYCQAIIDAGARLKERCFIQRDRAISGWQAFTWNEMTSKRLKITSCGGWHFVARERCMASTRLPSSGLAY